MKIAVKSGKVHVTVPFLNMDRSFEGLLTGDPLGNNEDYQQTMERIETLIAESQKKRVPRPTIPAIRDFSTA